VKSELVFVGLLLFACIVFDSCQEGGCNKGNGDQRAYCTVFYFSVVSKQTKEDLIYGPNPILTDGDDVVACANFWLDGQGCSNVGFTGPSLENRVINGSKVAGAVFCGSSAPGDWTDVRLIVKDSIVYKIDYIQQGFDDFLCTKPSENHFLELTINGILQCAPCQPDHLTVFEVDL